MYTGFSRRQTVAIGGLKREGNARRSALLPDNHGPPPCSGFVPVVAVMETADLPDSHDSSLLRWLYCARLRRVLGYLARLSFVGAAVEQSTETGVTAPVAATHGTTWTVVRSATPAAAPAGATLGINPLPITPVRSGMDCGVSAAELLGLP
jgi:hypothetical protein